MMSNESTKDNHIRRISKTIPPIPWGVFMRLVNRFTLVTFSILIPACARTIDLTSGAWKLTAYPASDDRERSFAYQKLVFHGDQQDGHVDPLANGGDAGKYQW